MEFLWTFKCYIRSVTRPALHLLFIVSIRPGLENATRELNMGRSPWSIGSLCWRWLCNWLSSNLVAREGSGNNLSRMILFLPFTEEFLERTKTLAWMQEHTTPAGANEKGIEWQAQRKTRKQDLWAKEEIFPRHVYRPASAMKEMNLGAPCSPNVDNTKGRDLLQT